LANAELARVAPGARVATDVVLSPFVCIGPEVEVGPGTYLAPNVTIIGKARIGARVRVGAGTVIGCDGFGYEHRDGTYHLLEHDGPVTVEDDVHIGANVTIARARTGRETRIGRGTKIDCQVHIGHNVTIGRHCIIVAQVGISGSVVIGDRVQLAGQVGIKDHVTIGDDSVIYAKSALYRSVPAGSHYSGIPARPHVEEKRFWARLRRTFGREK
jgi:UDP-3-O-[3-hydroxymyristoyl] glucosamine N-acyltransferase